MAASASAPGAEPQKQLLSIIRDFAAEKSHGERTVSGLKRRLDDVLAAADAATAELEAAKRAREAAETDLRGTQVQASIAAATIQALEATISHLQEEIAKVGSELEELKSKEDSERDEFISQMVEMNARIRQFQQMASVELARKCSEVSADGEQGKAADGNQGKGTDGHNVSDKNETAESEDMVTDLADKLGNIEAEMHALEEEYQKDLLDHKQVCQELADVQAKRALIEAVMDETKQLQELSLTGHKRVAEMEKVLNSVAEELQRRYTCPGCGTNNMGGMEEEAARTSSN
ncbi:hypothetical protein QYE76_029079 [Lolium multiflorum]|uniref:Uncharacterized protein n=1 Tax=Lolium multiflorum TaxID=4521 RepID=A0AAD8VHI8_LOLMU|nr:hypothetical protein QYE76_029079 [Lolium multiflorum]